MHYLLRQSDGTMAMTNDIKEVIEAVVRERLSAAPILDVEIEEDEDFEGNAIFRVMVIYDQATGLIDAQKAAGLVRHTRSRLGEHNVVNFPIFRFVSQSDAKKLKSAAA
jgi:hypothetical protein